jgi:hypothetical protein
MTKERKPTNKRRDDTPIDLDWFEELSFFVAANGYRVLKRKIDDINFAYVVVDRHRQVVLSVESPRDLRFVKQRRRGKKPSRS